MAAPGEPALETTAPRAAPPPPVRATTGALLRLHDHGLLDAPTTRRALAKARRGASLAEVLEAAGVHRSLRDKADELVRPLSTRLDGATAAALALVPPAVATLAGELTRVGGREAGALVALGGVAVLVVAPARPVKAGGAAAATAAILALLAGAVPHGAAAAITIALAAAGALALRPVGVRARSSAGGTLAGAAIEAVRVMVAG